MQQDIPDLDQEAFDKEFQKLVDEFKAFADKYEAKSVSDSDAEDFINQIYKYRQDGLKAEGEWSLGNLLFKEFRNKGYLDNLKDMKDKLKAARLSLLETLQDFYKLRALLARTVHDQPLLHENGIFEFNLIKEADVQIKVQALKRLDIVDTVEAYPSGKYDFSTLSNFTHPTRY